MPTSVDQLSEAQVLQRMSELVEFWRTIVSRILVQELAGAGPVGLADELHGGKALLVANGVSTAAITLTLPADAEVGVLFLVDQVGPAPVKLAPAARLRHRLGHNGSAGQWASLSVKCIRNPDGASAEWLLAGDTAVVG